MITYNLSLLASLYNNFDFFIVESRGLGGGAMKTRSVQPLKFVEKICKKITNIFRPNLTLIWPWSETLQKKWFFLATLV